MEKVVTLERRINELSAIETDQQEILSDLEACDKRLQGVLHRVKLLLGGSSKSRDSKDTSKKLTDRVEMAIREKRNKK